MKERKGRAGVEREGLAQALRFYCQATRGPLGWCEGYQLPCQSEQNQYWRRLFPLNYIALHSTGISQEPYIAAEECIYIQDHGHEPAIQGRVFCDPLMEYCLRPL